VHRGAADARAGHPRRGRAGPQAPHQPGLTGTNGVSCQPGLTGTNGICCPPQMTGCGNLCTDTNSDTDNCGCCGNECPSGYICGDGVCVNSCPKDQDAFTGCCTAIFIGCMAGCATSLLPPLCVGLCIADAVSCSQCDTWPCNQL
jgi:hypothetical protein